ncbi:hydroxymethylglutaryl-CoA lyase [Oceanicoccus sp. KOV_DT_Chl]|uniref:hydroxymethylglutaryl-CoA lyase n=1 Tax=Oceanicoccus sp. KOV_DT_Chl TaxID=1904639 RepID=UPI000C7B6E27|nr:hydroxymethylglutaryl-CoA lyase [Oceanicoccus sp. KOV_DT_Chl]
MSIFYPKQVHIVEVGPRDGLQNEKQAIDTSIKVALIEKLTEAGVQYVESGSFVNPKWVPQMAGSEAVFTELTRVKGVTYAALTPNLQGFERALSVHVDEVAIFAAASETFSQKNINCSIAESISRFEPVIAAASEHNIPVRGYISCVAGCPYEGDIASEAVAKVAAQLSAMGCYEVSLGDTIGTGSAGSVSAMLDKVISAVPADKLAVHFHDTYGQALTNIFVALQKGISVIDSSVAGLGGCPYAKGASGNVATEDVVYMLNGLNIHTGINLDKLIDAGNFISAALGRDNQSKVARALISKR